MCDVIYGWPILNNASFRRVSLGSNSDFKNPLNYLTVFVITKIIAASKQNKKELQKKTVYFMTFSQSEFCVLSNLFYLSFRFPST